ncbi:MAG: EAL domain-containing protein, partial [Acidimicrobiia bacterium]
MDPNLPSLADAELETAAIVERLLRAVREHLDLEVAFVGEVGGGKRTYRFVDAADGALLVRPGDADPLEATYCGHVLAGRLPQFLLDPTQDPFAASLPMTSAGPVGTFLSVPIRFSGGEVYGTFCCFSREVKTSVGPGDLRALQMMAELAGEYIERVEIARRVQRSRRREVEAINADPMALEMVFQPITDLKTMRMVGVEALARFRGGLRPDRVFAEADALGLGLELELVALRRGPAALDDLPGHVVLNVNVSPATMLSAGFRDALREVDGRRVVVEVTEHAAVDDYGALKAVAVSLADSGTQLAI